MWSVVIERFDSAGNPLKDVRASFKNYDDAVAAFKAMRAEFIDDPLKVVTMVGDEQGKLNFELDPALERIEAQRKHEAEEQRIQALCDEFEGKGMCGEIVPLGDEYDRNHGQCHVCEEWGIVICDMGAARSRPLCEKHLKLAVEERLQTFINIYGTSRVYGGPEEGGWWFTAGEPLVSIPICTSMSDSDVEDFRDDIRDSIKNNPLLGMIPWHDRYENIIVLIELRPGRYFPIERPHYE